MQVISCERKHNRLRGYDYRQSGYYFLTICENNRQCVFGDIVNYEMKLNKFGEIIRDQLSWMQENFPYVRIDTSVIMPNHIHLVAIMENGPDNNLDPITGLNLTELNNTFQNVNDGRDRSRLSLRPPSKLNRYPTLSARSKQHHQN